MSWRREFGLPKVTKRIRPVPHSTWHLYRKVVDADAAQANVPGPEHPHAGGQGSPARSPLQYFLQVFR